jgi:hypothetical protein
MTDISCFIDHKFGSFIIYFLYIINYISEVVVSVPTSSAEDRGFEPRSSQTKDYKIGICCFSTT